MALMFNGEYFNYEGNVYVRLDLPKTPCWCLTNDTQTIMTMQVGEMHDKLEQIFKENKV
jgi:hypothetical protein